jgi:hypothetical protein
MVWSSMRLYAWDSFWRWPTLRCAIKRKKIISMSRFVLQIRSIGETLCTKVEHLRTAVINNLMDN